LQHLNYVEFRQTLFSGEANRLLANFNAKIVIYDNQNKVDKSTYSLRKDANANDLRQ